MGTLQLLAFDLGATSGRSILGRLDGDGRLELRELTRFANGMLRLGGRLHWNIFSLYEELKRGMAAAAAEGVVPDSIGIDTWGVDYAAVAPDGTIVGLPYAYRDPGLDGAAGRFFAERMSASELYRLTGIQHMDFNTAFQLNDRRDGFALRAAERVLMLPDALTYLLTGEMVTEYTIASTGAIVNPYTRTLSEPVLASLGLAKERFGRLVQPATVVGRLSAEVAREVGLPQVPVVAVAGHDTASAVAAIPSPDERFAYLSSGTWSLMGIEVRRPVVNELTEGANITNEGGVGGTIRLLKNITGMWLVEQCLQSWARAGVRYDYAEMVELAKAAEPVCRLDPDDKSFAAPADMPSAIDAYCAATGQPRPRTHGQMLRSIFESLAAKYADVLATLRTLAETPIERLHVIGGGSRNAFLNQLTADRCGVPVVAGPAEATALGNIMVQAMAAGRVADLGEMRRLIARNVETTTFNPNK